MKQEPVAWLIKTDQENGGDVVWPEELKEVTNFYKNENWEYKLIPLYTEPQYRELSDEEINSVWFSSHGDLKDFARAILKKASEK